MRRRKRKRRAMAMVMRNADYFRTLFFSSWRKAWMPCGPHGRLPLYSRERQHPTRGQRWLLSVYDTLWVYQLYNSTQSPRPCKISSKPYSPSPKSHHLPKIVRLLLSCPSRSPPHSPTFFVRSQSGISTKSPHSGHTRAPALQPWPSAQRSTNRRPKVRLSLRGGAYIIVIIIIIIPRPHSDRRPPYPWAIIELAKTGGSFDAGAFGHNRVGGRWSWSSRLCYHGRWLSDP